MNQKCTGSWCLYRRLLQQAWPYWHWIGLFLLVSLLGTPLALLLPLPVKLVVDSIIGSQPAPAWLNAALPIDWTDTRLAALAAAALMILFAGLTLCQQMSLALLRTVVGEKLLMSFRERLFSHAQRLSLRYHDSTGSADSIYRIQSDASAVQSVVIESFVPLLSAVVMVCSMLVVTARVNLQLALIGLAVCPPLILMTAAFRPRLRRQWREVKALESTVQSVVQEVLGSMRVVKAFSREDHENSRFRTHYRRGVAARIKAAVQETCYTFLTGLTIAAGTAAVLLVGVGEVRSGDLALGSLLLIMAYLKHLYDPLKTIGRQLTSRQKALVSVERAFRLLDEVIEVPERADARPLMHATGRVSFRNVAFAYPEGPRVFAGVTFDVPAGTWVGIAGPTGAGKTTLLNLLTRSYDPSEGRILLDSVDLRDYKLADLRHQFSIVLQEPVLFSTSIGENIAYGRPGASEAEIITAARAADVHDFIASLPDGYETLVGERGMRLSGGERQRISLARAFLKDAPILILDEPTSSVDPLTERAIMAAMKRLMRGRTTFMIAHRIDTLQNCGLLLRVERGLVRVASAETPKNTTMSLVSNSSLVDNATTVSPLEHPAAIAWLAMNPSGGRPTAVTTLKAKSRSDHPSGVYRLGQILAGNRSVVAKRSRRTTAVVERLIYESLLPSLPLSQPEFYGALDEGLDVGTMWLFLQDVRDTRVAPEHSVLLAQWLAKLHITASDSAIVGAANLPQRGLDAHRERMERSYQRLRTLSTQWATQDRARDRAILEHVTVLLEHLERRWATFAGSADVLPPTLTHGDFVPKNIRVGGPTGGPTLYVFDWETAGWGSPAPDLACLAENFPGDPNAAIAAYSAAIGRRWPAIDLEAVNHARRVGVVLRYIAAIDWTVKCLNRGWDIRPLRILETYAVQLRKALGPREGLNLL